MALLIGEDRNHHVLRDIIHAIAGLNDVGVVIDRALFGIDQDVASGTRRFLDALRASSAESASILGPVAAT